MGGKRLFWAMLMLAGAAGCTPQLRNIADPDVVAGGVPVTAPHTLSPGDTFDIRFVFDPALNDNAVVGADGKASLQLIGDVPVGGLTVPEATRLLKERYAAVVRDPRLSVSIRLYAPQQIYVGGWVNKPGLLRSNVPLTVGRAIAEAGGAKTGAKTDDVLLIRRDADGNTVARRVALGNFDGVPSPDQDTTLRSFDVVYVPQTEIVAVTDFIGQIKGNIPFYFNYQYNNTAGRTSVTTPGQLAPPRPVPAPVPTTPP